MRDLYAPPHPSADEVRHLRDGSGMGLIDAKKVLRQRRRQEWLNDLGNRLPTSDIDLLSDLLESVINYLKEENDR